MRRRYTFEEIMKMDYALFQLSMYETAKGQIFVPKSPEELAQFQIATSKTFNYFKNMIRNGETSLEELKTQVSNRWGAILQKNRDPEDIDGLLKDIEEENEMRENEEKAVSNIGNILKAIFSGQQMEGLQEIPMPSPQALTDEQSDVEQVEELHRIGNPFTIKVNPSPEEKKPESTEDSGYNKGDAKANPKTKKPNRPKKSK